MQDPFPWVATERTEETAGDEQRYMDTELTVVRGGAYRWT